MAAYLFHQGTNYKAYEYLGVHKTEAGYIFRVWAPNAERVCVVGDFNNWNDKANIMSQDMIKTKSIPKRTMKTQSERSLSYKIKFESLILAQDERWRRA